MDMNYYQLLCSCKCDIVNILILLLIYFRKNIIYKPVRAPNESDINTENKQPNRKGYEIISKKWSNTSSSSFREKSEHLNEEHEFTPISNTELKWD